MSGTRRRLETDCANRRRDQSRLGLVRSQWTTSSRGDQPRKQRSKGIDRLTELAILITNASTLVTSFSCHDPGKLPPAGGPDAPLLNLPITDTVDPIESPVCPVFHATAELENRKQVTQASQGTSSTDCSVLHSVSRIIFVPCACV